MTPAFPVFRIGKSDTKSDLEKEQIGLGESPNQTYGKSKSDLGSKIRFGFRFTKKVKSDSETQIRFGRNRQIRFAWKRIRFVAPKTNPMSERHVHHQNDHRKYGQQSCFEKYGRRSAASASNPLQLSLQCDVLRIIMPKGRAQAAQATCSGRCPRNTVDISRATRSLGMRLSHELYISIE